jgi:hypothetical protein
LAADAAAKAGAVGSAVADALPYHNDNTTRDISPISLYLNVSNHVNSQSKKEDGPSSSLPPLI